MVQAGHPCFVSLSSVHLWNAIFHHREPTSYRIRDAAKLPFSSSASMGGALGPGSAQVPCLSSIFTRVLRGTHHRMWPHQNSQVEHPMLSGYTKPSRSSPVLVHPETQPRPCSPLQGTPPSLRAACRSLRRFRHRSMPPFGVGTLSKSQQQFPTPTCPRLRTHHRQARKSPPVGTWSSASHARLPVAHRSASYRFCRRGPIRNGNPGPPLGSQTEFVSHRRPFPRLASRREQVFAHASAGAAVALLSQPSQSRSPTKSNTAQSTHLDISVLRDACAPSWPPSRAACLAGSPMLQACCASHAPDGECDRCSLAPANHGAPPSTLLTTAAA